VAEEQDKVRPKYVDIHSHLQFPQYDQDRGEVLARMQEAGVWTITVGTDLTHSEEAVSFAHEHEGVFATVGLHPNSASEEQFDEDSYAKLVSDEKIVAVGECGLDYYRSDVRDANVKRRQHEQFEKQITFALAHNKPLMLHCRPSHGSMDAYEDVLAILKAFPKARGNTHFFVGTSKIAKGFLGLGFTLSFTGVLTFARDYDETVRYVPLESILVETDAPFAAPVPHRGKRNEPAYVAEVVKAVARIRGEKEEVVRAAVLDNAVRVFALES